MAVASISFSKALWKCQEGLVNPAWVSCLSFNQPLGLGLGGWRILIDQIPVTALPWSQGLQLAHSTAETREEPICPLGNHLLLVRKVTSLLISGVKSGLPYNERFQDTPWIMLAFSLAVNGWGFLLWFLLPPPAVTYSSCPKFVVFACCSFNKDFYLKQI